MRVVGGEHAADSDGIVPRSEICRQLGILQTDRGRYWIVSWALFWLDESGRARPHPGLGWSAVPHSGSARLVFAAT